MKILTAPHPSLKEVCHDIAAVDFKIIADMFRLMRKHDALGLSAPQVGWLMRVFVTRWGEVFVNPAVVSKSIETDIENEGCLSIPDKIVPVRRSLTINIGGRVYSGLRARVIQHELDHLDGVLITDAAHDISTPRTGLRVPVPLRP